MSFQVHVRIGDDMGMGNVNYAAYDPIFYLHHSYVDYQYAYWQKLQKIRGKRQGAKKAVRNREMPPFSGYTDPAGIDVNPIEATKKYNTQLGGLDYETNFQYCYDELTFDKMTPEQFDDSLCTSSCQAGYIVINNNRVTYTEISANYQTRVAKVVGAFATIGNNKTGAHSFIDVTDYYNDNNFDFDERKKVHYTVKTFDIEGNQIDANALKPLNEFFDDNDQRFVTIHVDYFDQYNSNFTIKHLKNYVQFLNIDGSYANGVTVHTNQVIINIAIIV